METTLAWNKASKPALNDSDPPLTQRSEIGIVQGARHAPTRDRTLPSSRGPDFVGDVAISFIMNRKAAEHSSWT
jgi:hypothetical protein